VQTISKNDNQLCKKWLKKCARKTARIKMYNKSKKNSKN
jgi:hypothetical protein